MICPVRKMEGEIVVSVPPVVADSLIALYDQVAHTKSFESCGDVKTAGKRQYRRDISIA